MHKNNIIDDLYQAIAIAYEQYYPCQDKHAWTIMQLTALLENILLDNPQLESYYKDFAANIKML